MFDNQKLENLRAKYQAIAGNEIFDPHFQEVVSGWVVTAHANAFDDCVLENMRGVTSDAAAKSIRVACLRKNSVILSIDELRGGFGLSARIAEPNVP